MRVLVVEDEPRIAEGLVTGLTRAGYVVETARDGEEAWFKGETEDYDAIVLDLGLPKLDGLSVLRKLRAANIATPILVLTARGSWSERVEGIDAGADDYLPKPFQFEELLARLGAIMRRRAGQLTPILTVADLNIDTRRMSVTVGGRAVDLSPLEFRALRYLVHNQGRVVSQVELGEHVYSSEGEPELQCARSPGRPSSQEARRRRDHHAARIRLHRRRRRAGRTLMKASSIRWRLAALAAFSIVVALTVACVSVEWIFERHMERRVGYELGIRLDELLGAFTLEGGEPKLQRALSDPLYEQPLSGSYWQISDETGPVLEFAFPLGSISRIASSKFSRIESFRNQMAGRHHALRHGSSGRSG